MPKWPAFCGGSNMLGAVSADVERTVNLYVEQTQSKGAQNDAALMPVPGYRAWSTAVSDIGARALAVANGRLFGIIAGGFYEWSSTGVPTKHGTVAQDSNPGLLVFNGVVGGQLGICSGGNIYSFVLSTNVLSAAHLTGGYTHLAYARGRGFAFNPTTGRVLLSNLNDLGTWSLGTFFQRSQFPDPWQTMFVDPSGLIWLIGSETFEVWYDTGTGTQPWAPLSGLVGRYGIAAPFAYGVSGAGMYWLDASQEGGSRVVTTKGSAPQVVSPYAVNTAIAGYRRSSGITDAEMLTYHDQGHTFLNITFPRASATWALDAETRNWAERGKWNSVTGTYDIWAPRVHADCFGKHLIGDRSSGTLYEMDTTISTEIDGTGIRRLRRAPALTDEGKRTPVDRVQLLMDTGVGTQSGQGEDPQALLRVSQDGGVSFGNERRASVGRVGVRKQRVYWDRLGAGEDTTVEIVWSDPVPTKVTNAWLNNTERVA